MDTDSQVHAYTSDSNYSGSTQADGGGNSNGYAKSNPRISKDDLFMILALWMEDFPLGETEVDEKISDDHKEQTLEAQEQNSQKDGKTPDSAEADKKAPVKNRKPNVPEDKTSSGKETSNKDVEQRKVGAVLVLPNDVFYAADCTRDGEHAVARLLMKHYDKAEGAKVFMSRKPCATCTKLLVQSKVNRVLYLPLEPEYHPLEPKHHSQEPENHPLEPENHPLETLRKFLRKIVAYFNPTIQKSW